jgi:hypothetical protein
VLHSESAAICVLVSGSDGGRNRLEPGMSWVGVRLALGENPPLGMVWHIPRGSTTQAAAASTV